MNRINFDKLFPFVRRHDWFKNMPTQIETLEDYSWLCIETVTHGEIHVGPTGEVSWYNDCFEFPTVDELQMVVTYMEEVQNLIELNFRNIQN